MQSRDFELAVARTVLVSVGLCLFTWGLWLRGEESRRMRRLQLSLLCLLAVVSFASYYHFFTAVHQAGFRSTDNFHYYVGSKYFGELGYFALYDCSLVAMAERGSRSVAPEQAVRDLHTMETGTASEALERGRDCPERFGAARWRAFGDDVEWFTRPWPPRIWQAVWDDYGYHPTPIWTLLGGAISGNLPTESAASMYALARVDRLIVAGGLLAIGSVFGLEAGCVAAVIWGTGHLWRYAFVGDAFLRHLWWIAAVAGVCLLRVGRHGVAGATLGLSALLRLFPGAFALGFFLRSLQQAGKRGRLQPALVRFVIGATGAGVVAIALAALTNGHGFAAFVEFAHKIATFTDLPATNKMGIDVATMWIFGVDTPAAQIAAWAGRLLFFFVFWRGLRGAQDWEAAALGWTLIPILTDPTNYYYSFVVLGVLLAVRRPRIGVIVLLACVAWNLNGVLYYRQYAEYWHASIIAVLCAAAVAHAMARPADARALQAEPEAGDVATCS